MVLITVLSFATMANSSIKNFKLKNIDEKTIELNSLIKDKKFLVVIAHGVGCPIMRKYIQTFNQLEKDYRNKNVKFLMINAVVNDDIKSIKKEVEDYDLQVPVYLDIDQSFLKSLNLKTLSGVALLDIESGLTLYKGAVNDRVNFDVAKKIAKHNYLINALDEVISGKTVSVKESHIYGCTILIK